MIHSMPSSRDLGVECQCSQTNAVHHSAALWATAKPGRINQHHKTCRALACNLGWSACNGRSINEFHQLFSWHFGRACAWSRGLQHRFQRPPEAPAQLMEGHAMVKSQKPRHGHQPLYGLWTNEATNTKLLHTATQRNGRV